MQQLLLLLVLGFAASSERVLLSAYYDPIRYDLILKVPFNVESQPGEYSGSVEIQFKCAQETHRVVLNVMDLEVDLNRVVVSDDKEIGVRSVSVDAHTQQLSVELDESIRTDRVYKVNLRFTGLLKNDKMGLYWGSYETADGVKRWYVASQVSRSLARKVFPCFDEPSLRAKFNLRVQHHASTNAISNSRELLRRKQLESGLVETQFEETRVPISTYQFAVVISDFMCKSNGDVRVCARPNAVDKTDVFRSAAVKSKDAFEMMLKTKFPLSKLDHVALPDTLYAIEDNLGVSLYRESVVFHDTLNPRPFIEQEIFKNVALQTSIMWLESMAPTANWNALWLNAGLSHLLAYIGADRVNLDFKYREQFSRYVFQALEFDSDGNMNAITHHEDEKRNQISREDFKIHLKSAAVLRMLMSVIGEERFFEFLKRYLEEGKVSNASRLWQVMQGTTDSVNISGIMDTWVNQEGYPWLQITKVSANQVNVQQRRFSMNDRPVDRQIWSIPITYSIMQVKGSSGATTMMWITEENQLVNLKQPLDESGFLLINSQFSGFYRVNYDHENWRKIIEQLKGNMKTITPVNRATLIEDSFNLAKAGILDLEVALDLSEYLENEDEIIAWVPGIYHLRLVLDSIDDGKTKDEFEKKLQSLVRPTFQTVYRKTNKTKLDTLLSNQITNFACHVNLQDCIEAMKKFHFTSMPTDLRQIGYCSAIRHGSEREFRLAFNEYKNIHESGNKQNFLDLQAALSCTLDEKLLEEYLNYVLAENKKEDVTRAISYAMSYHGVTGTWNYIQHNIKTISKKFGNDDAKIRGLSSLLLSRLKVDDLGKFQELFRGQEATTAKRIEFNRKLSAKISNGVRRWLRRNND